MQMRYCTLHPHDAAGHLKGTDAQQTEPSGHTTVTAQRLLLYDSDAAGEALKRERGSRYDTVAKNNG